MPSIALAEALLRLARGSWRPFYRPDPVLGEVPIPRAEGRDRSEKPIVVRFEARGIRDRARSSEKPAGTLRIAFLGDSEVEAEQVELEETASALLERTSAKRPTLGRRNVEVSTPGVAGYGTTQEPSMFEERARRFPP